ncbi:hypothetical protein [Streptomyces sp. CB03911]|uniref:hypothetical protein n=1 Tax=Streptomyces sp. CB03911 TaxID=1804758 RepID=UPI00093AB3CE|nr:hypothetical protein [Streptomyces sp. CB03911]OKI14174.1 hypothetical protein A6A07_13550 [Streptomyces sp. CB03911]
MSASADGDGTPLAEDRVAALVARAATRRAAAAARRQRLQAAREHGLLARHRLKLARLARHATEATQQAATEPISHDIPGDAA